MIDTSIKPLEELLRAAIFSAYLQVDKSFSVVIIAEPELYKTRTLMKFSSNHGISVKTDLTYLGIIEEVLPKIQNNEVKTIVIPDMLKAVSKKSATAVNFMTILNALVEEGVYEITLRNTKDFKGARCNVLTSITPDIYFDKRRQWNKIGFFSRVIPFTFKYDNDMKSNVFNAIGKYQVSDDKILLELPTYRKDVGISEHYTEVAEQYAVALGASEKLVFKLKDDKVYVKEGSIGFRHKWQFQAMLKTFALMRDNPEVDNLDVEKLGFLSQWMNYEFNPL